MSDAEARCGTSITTTRVDKTHQKNYAPPSLEPKTVKNRVHWDAQLSGPRPTVLLDAGAVVLREPGGDILWWVLADPEGNEFCAHPAR
jgi:hypothetical protein